MENSGAQDVTPNTPPADVDDVFMDSDEDHNADDRCFFPVCIMTAGHVADSFNASDVHLGCAQGAHSPCCGSCVSYSNILEAVLQPLAQFLVILM